MIGNNKKSTNKKKKYLGIFMAILVLAGASFSAYRAYAKYYASRNNKGIIMAANLYFNSDKLKKSTGVTNLDQIVNNPDNLNRINVFTNSGTWSSGILPLSFDIRNFDNNILYNESNLDIEYKIEFYMLDEPKGALYYIIGADGSTTPLASKGARVELGGTVTGGSLDSDTYIVQVRMTSPEEYEESRVLVMAYPVSPDYVAKASDMDQEYRLLGIFVGHPTTMKITIDNAQFLVQDVDTYSLSTWYSMVKDLSAYIYNVKTAGDIVIDENTATKQQARITWDNRYLNIDEYDENYKYALQHDSDPTLTDDEKYLKTDGNNSSMIVEVLPYTSINFTFYKTELFDSTFATKPNNATGKEWFEGLVKSEIVEE